MAVKKYLTKTINFGKRGTLSRTWIEEFTKQYGNRALSREIRRLINSAYGGNPQDAYFQKEVKKRSLLNARLEAVKQMQASKVLIVNIDEELVKLGYDPEQEVLK